VGGVQRHQLDLLGVGRQVQLRHAQRVHAFLDLDQTGLLQQQNAARQVAGVVGQGHAVAFLQVGQALALLAVHAHGGDGALGQCHQVQLAVTLELVEVDLVLEEVGVQRTVGQGQVGLHVVVELHQLDLVALLLQLGHDAVLQLVDVGAGRAADHQLLLAGVLGQRRGRQADRGGSQHGSGQDGTAGGEQTGHGGFSWDLSGRLAARVLKNGLSVQAVRVSGAGSALASVTKETGGAGLLQTSGGSISRVASISNQ
jgi:hypothetical protein